MKKRTNKWRKENRVKKKRRKENEPLFKEEEEEEKKKKEKIFVDRKNKGTKLSEMLARWRNPEELCFASTVAGEEPVKKRREPVK